MSDHVDKAEAWDASRASWQKGYDRGVAEAAAENAALRQIISDAAAELERMRSERPYIIGFNDGWEAAKEPDVPGDDLPFTTATTGAYPGGNHDT